MAVRRLYWRFTVADYARMREVGILAEDARVELLDGDLRPMSPIGPRHAAIVNRLTRALAHHAGDALIVSVQNPLQLSDYSEPQPDLLLLRQRDDFYAHSHPQPEDVLLLIEVADTSLDYDREEKLPRYAAAEIAEVWLVDVAGGRVFCYSQPRGGSYHLIRIVEQADLLLLAALPTLALPAEQLFG